MPPGTPTYPPAPIKSKDFCSVVVVYTGNFVHVGHHPRAPAHHSGQPAPDTRRAAPGFARLPRRSCPPTSSPSSATPSWSGRAFRTPGTTTPRSSNATPTLRTRRGPASSSVRPATARASSTRPSRSSRRSSPSTPAIRSPTSSSTAWPWPTTIRSSRSSRTRRRPASRSSTSASWSRTIRRVGTPPTRWPRSTSAADVWPRKRSGWRTTISARATPSAGRQRLELVIKEYPRTLVVPEALWLLADLNMREGKTRAGPRAAAAAAAGVRLHRVRPAGHPAAARPEIVHARHRRPPLRHPHASDAGDARGHGQGRGGR